MPENKKLTGKVAIVTGAGGGIGEGVAMTFARSGASVAVVDINLDGAKRVASSIEQIGGSSLPLQIDVTKRSEAGKMVEEVVKKWGTVDILVNNAGGFSKMSSLLELPEDEWDMTMALNLKSVYVCSQAVAKIMMEKRSGSIVSMGSRLALAPSAGGADNLPYGAAKAGVLCISRLLAKILGPYNVTVNSVSPSTVATERVRKVRTPESLQKIAEGTVLGHLVEVEDIANAILFLVSEDARYITGVNLNVNAGNFMM